MNATDTLDTLKSGTTQIAETTGQAVSGLAGTAKKQATAVIGEVAERIAQHTSLEPPKPKRRRGRLFLGLALGGAAAGWLVKLARGTALGHKAEEAIIDLTHGSRTDEATVESLGSQGLDPVARGGAPS
ncbi:MAG TPA: hypothetical protein VM097_10690 [Mycobacteriales bacterium]|nr:hypothetical protein [Mycobacteriales bacterium]